MGIFEGIATLIVFICSITIIVKSILVLKQISDELWGARPN